MPFFKRHQTTIISGILYQLGWFLCVFTATWLWLLYLCLFTVLHYLFVSKDVKYWHFSIKMMVLGCFMDAFLSTSGVFIFTGTVLPFWLIGLWYMFALSLPYAFGFFRGKYWLAGSLGAVSAVSTYIGGSYFREDMQLMQPMLSAAIFIFIAWVIYLPHAFFQLARTEKNT